MISLYQGLENTLPDRGHRVLQFAASCRGEGTSTIVKEFSRVVTKRFGKSVLVLDADQSHPTQHLFLGVTPRHYLEEVLKNGLALEKAIYRQGESRPALSLIAVNHRGTTGIFDSPEIHGLLDRIKGPLRIRPDRFTSRYRVPGHPVHLPKGGRAGPGDGGRNHPLAGSRKGQRRDHQKWGEYHRGGFQ